MDSESLRRTSGAVMIEELLTAVLCETNSLCHLIVYVFDQFVELVFVLDDNRYHCPLEVFLDLFDWVEMR
jgi:hypothetical protein